MPPPVAIRRSHRLRGELRQQFEAIYRDSFPPEQREDLDRLARRIALGQAVLYTAHGPSKLVGFALILPLEVQGVYLLDYLAVDPAHRGCGVGRSLLGHVKGALRRCPGASGIFIEVESDEWGAEAERGLRSRRIAFYRRNGAVPLPLRSHLRVPALAGGGHLYSRLLWVSLGGPPPRGERLRQCIRSFFSQAYGMSPEDALVAEALGGIGENEPGPTSR